MAYNNSPIFLLHILCSFSWDTFWVAVGGIGAILTAGATFWLVIVGIRQLKGINKTSKEGFLEDLKKDFFTKEARFLLVLVQYDLLEFHTIQVKEDSAERFAYFSVKSINNPEMNKALMDIMVDGKESVSSFEMDDFLLQHLEDVGFLYRKRIVDIIDVEQLFGYYIVTIFESGEVKKYIDWAKEDDPDIYSNFEYVYHELKLHENKTR